jgi:hypothetical protein
MPFEVVPPADADADTSREPEPRLGDSEPELWDGDAARLLEAEYVAINTRETDGGQGKESKQEGQSTTWKKLNHELLRKCHTREQTIFQPLN